MFPMKNITFSADAGLIHRARAKASEENRSLNDAFRQWLEQYTANQAAGENFGILMRRIGYAAPGKKFTREELNERR